MLKSKIIRKVKIALTGLCLLFNVCIATSTLDGRWVYVDTDDDGEPNYKYCAKPGSDCETEVHATPRPLTVLDRLRLR